jgi:hypothetical protein
MTTMGLMNLISRKTITEEFMKRLSRLGLGYPPPPLRIGLEFLLPKSGSLQLKMLFLVLLL